MRGTQRRGDAPSVFSARARLPRAPSMKLKQLESLLQDVEPFREPDQMLEQYPTGAHLASRVVTAAHAHGDIEDRSVVDLGVGGGVLTIASLLMGATKVTGLDLDPHALDLTRENCAAFDPPLEPTLAIARIPRDIARARRGVTREEIREIDARDAARARITTERSENVGETTSSRDETMSDDDCGTTDVNLASLRADTVITNPPFGTRRKGADVGFLRAGLMIARRAVYSLNKTSTRAFVEKHATRTLRAASATVLAELRYELPRTYAHHRRDVVEIEVDLWRFEPPADGRVGGAQIERDDETTSSETSEEEEEEEEGESASDDGEKNGARGGTDSALPELKYAGARGAFCDRRGFEPRREGRSGGKGARDARAVIAGGRESARRGRGGGRSGGGGRGRGRR